MNETEMIAELVEALEKLTFVAETVAHLRGLEREILPLTEAARATITKATNS